VSYRVFRSARANRDLTLFSQFARSYGQDWAARQLLGINRVFSIDLPRAPHQWSYFYLTGAPYRPYLFRAGRKIQYWIVYSVDDAAQTVNILRFWNASRDPDRFRP